MLGPFIPRPFVDQVLGVSPDGPSSFCGTSSDSRSVEAGQLFFALVGERADGHDYLPQALERGASGVVCRKGFAPKKTPHGVAVYEVPDTLAAYRKLAASWRARFAIPVVAVAGSVGKTTTKELLSACLRGRYPSLLKTEGSQNGFVGIPMTLLRLEDHHQAAVIEIGIDDEGAMADHLEVVRPTAAVVTAIAEEHLEKLHNLESVAKEEGLALQWVSRHGGAIAINLDDPWLAPYGAQSGTPHRLSYSLTGKKADLQARYDSQSAQVSLGAARFAVPVPGEHNARNLVAAIAVSRLLGLSDREIEQGLRHFQAPPGRSRVVALACGPTVVCDYYNASPASMRAGLDLLADTARNRPGKRVACLADMLELGNEEHRYHEDLATPLQAAQVERVFLFGPRMRALFLRYQKEPWGAHLRHYDAIESLIADLLKEVAPQDTVLIKGSRGMKMERVFHALESRYKIAT